MQAVINGNTNKEINMRFSVEELLKAGNTKWDINKIDTVIKRNLQDLCLKINSLGYQPPMYATSCLRSIESQKRINPKAMGSSHLYGAAIDIADPDGKLKAWILKDPTVLTYAGLWMEDPQYTKNKNGQWIHLQTYAPRSGKRIFIP